MNSFMNKVKNASKFVADTGNKTKIRGELVLIEREINNHKQMFGVDVFDIMVEVEKKNKKLWSSGYKNEENQMRIEFETAKNELKEIEKKQDEKQQQIDVLDVRMTNKMPASNIGDKMKNGASVAKEATQKAKLKGEILILDREIKARKQTFGVVLYDLMFNIETNNKKWKPSDKNVNTCYESAKTRIGFSISKREKKERQIIALGGTIETTPAAAAAASTTN